MTFTFCCVISYFWPKFKERNTLSLFTALVEEDSGQDVNKTAAEQASHEGGSDVMQTTG